MPYQARWFSDTSQVMVWEKSRRIGATWADAAKSALDAARINGNDTYYLAINKEMTLDYIENVSYWAKAYQLAATQIEQTVIKDEDEDILVFRVRFASGFKVAALSSRPSSLRGKQGSVVVDECAFLQDLDEVRKAAMALTMWNGQIRYISTHNGVNNPFNKLCEEVRSRKLGYSLHRTTLADAIADGLYKRISLVSGEEWTLEKEFAWYNQLYKDYGIGADEELGCEPLDVKGGGKVFDRTLFEIVKEEDLPTFNAQVRFWDMAATAREFNADSFYTAGLHLGRFGSDYYVVHLIADQVGPAEGDDLIVATAQHDGRKVPVRWELEGGSAGLKVEANLRSRLSGYDARGVKPLGDKLTRAKPIAGEVKRGNVKLLRGAWNQMFLDAVHGFDGTSQPLINDVTDALSGAYGEISTVRHYHVGGTVNRVKVD
jgi:predicted phage terminase large subunit-like protein